MRIIDELTQLLRQIPTLDWRIDLASRTLTFDHRTIIKDGKLDDRLDIRQTWWEGMGLNLTECYIDGLYKNYAQSQCDRTEHKHLSAYFEAKRYDATDGIIMSDSRTVTRFRLECVVLFAICFGNLQQWPAEWEEQGHRHFHPINGDADCIMRREWIEPDYKRF